MGVGLTYMDSPTQWAAVTALVLLRSEAPQECDPERRRDNWCGWLLMFVAEPPTMREPTSRLIATKRHKVITTMVIRPLDDPHMMCSICDRRFTTPLSGVRMGIGMS